MAKWAYHKNYAAEGKAYQKRTGKTQEEVAKELDTTLATYRNLCYGSKKPSDTLAQRSAALFGCSVTRFMDDPGQEIAGQSAAHLTQARRHVANLMFEGITAEDLSDEDAMLLYEDYLAARDRLIALKKIMRQQDGAT